jgi:hypothetical protein
MSDSLEIVLIVLAMTAAVALRRPIRRALRRFDAKNAERRMQEYRSAFDQYAHYRQTVDLVEEQVEHVSTLSVPDERTGEPVTRYVFLGHWYPTRTEAEEARRAVVIEKAREFYVDLDRVFLSRRWGRARPKAVADPAKHRSWTPPKS